MRKRIISWIFFYILLLFNPVLGQSASGTWSLLSNQTCTVSGQITTNDMAIATALQGTAYNSTFQTSTGWMRVGTTSGSQLPNGYSATAYVEFTIAPTTNYNLTITSINANLAGGGSGNNKVAAYYSTDGFSSPPGTALGTATYNGSTYAATTGTPIPVLNTSSLTSSVEGLTTFSPNLTVNSGQILKIRFYSWNVGSINKYLAIKNVVISGTTTSAGLTPPSLTAATSPSVDAPFDVTFTDNSAWRTAITGVKVGGTTLSSGYSVSAGKITFTSSSSSPTSLLQLSGSKSIAISATGYTDATLTQSVGFGTATKLGMQTQPAGPTTNGSALATQPILNVQDQYGNTVTSNNTAVVTASAGSGSWTIGGAGIVKTAIAGIVTFYSIAASSYAAVTGATINFSSSGLTGVSSGTFNIPVPAPPTITAASSPTVDAPFTVTFTDNPTWRGAITGITVGGSSLPTTAYDITTAGQITFTPSQSALLESSGSKSIVIISTGYSNNTYTQSIGAGAATKLAVTTQPTAPASNGATLATQPIVVIQDQYGNATTSTADIVASVGNGSWTIGGITTKTASSGSSTFTDLTATSAASVLSATISFSSTGLTGVTSSSFAIPAPPGNTPPALTASSGAAVDAAFDITFTDDNTWQGVISGITVNGTALDPSTFNKTVSNKITFTPSLSTLLQSSGTKTIVISATGYNDATVSQAIGAGVVTQLVMKTQPVTPVSNGALFATQPEVYVKDQYANLTTGTVLAAVTGSQAWNLGGTASVTASSVFSTFTDLTAGTTGKVAMANASITFSCGSATVTTNTFNIIAYQSSASDYFKTTQSGDWSSTSTWVSSPDNGTNWYAATIIPGTSAPSVVVANATTMNSNSTIGNLTINSDASLTIGSSAVMTFTTAKTVNINGILENNNPIKTSIVSAGTINFNSGSTYKLSAAMSTTTNCTGVIPTAIWNSASTVLISGSTNNTGAITGIGQTFGNLTYNCPNQTAALTLGAAQNLIINSTFSVINTGSGILQLTSSGNTVNLIAGSYNQTGGTVYINNNAGSTGARILTVGDFNIDNTAGTSTFYFANAASGKTTTGVLFISKSMYVGSGANIYQTVASPPGTNTACIHFNGTSAQSITINGVLNGVINDSIQNSTGVNLNTNFTANNIVLASGDLSTHSNTLAINGNTSGSGNIITSTVGTLVYSGSSTQTISNIKDNTVNNLTINNANGVTLSNGLTTTTSLTIGSGATLNVPAGKQLTVLGTLTNNGNLHLYSATDGSVATLKTPSSVTGTGIGTIDQYLAGLSGSLARGWWYVSSPVSNANADVFIPNGSSNKFGYWDETTCTYPQISDVNSSSTALNAGQGYVFYNSGNDATVSFNGTLNAGDVTVYPTRTGVDNGARGFNLVGNPYPSYLDWNAATKTNVRNTIWYRTFTSGGQMQFDTYDGSIGTSLGMNGQVSNYIPPMQGFWVKVNADGDNASVVFHNADRSHQDQSSATNRLRVKAQTTDAPGIVRLRVSNSVNADETILVADPNASDAADSSDSPKMKNNNAEIPEIFTVAGTEEMVINHLNNFSVGKELTLGFRPGKVSDFSIAANEISNVSSDLKVVLVDKLTNATYDLTDGSAYTFSTSDATATTTRFSVQFKSAGVVNGIAENTNDKIVVYGNAQHQITVNLNNLSVNGNVSVFNAVGQKLIEQPVTGNLFTIKQNFVSGIYVVELTVNSQRIIKKVILQ